MNDDPVDSTRTPDLRPTIARLEEIARKCESMGSRNREFPDMAARVREVIAALRAVADSEPAYRELAQRLFPVARLFESLGFQSVAREIAHVERSLEALAAPARTGGTAAAPRRLPASSPAPGDGAPPRVAAVGPGPKGGAGDPGPPSRKSVPTAVVLAALAVLLTVVVCAVVILRFDSAGAHLQPTPAPTAAPPTPTPSTPRIHPTAEPAEAERLADRQALVDEVSAARRALQSGDRAAAALHLDAAAVHDPSAGLVIAVAGELVESHLVTVASAIERADWQEADAEIATAAAIARRFALDMGRIDDARRRLEGSVRYLLIGPGETAALRSVVGLKVEVFRERGEPERGVLDRVDGTTLVLTTDQEVHGGSILFQERIPLDQVRYVKAYPAGGESGG